MSDALDKAKEEFVKCWAPTMLAGDVEQARMTIERIIALAKSEGKSEGLQEAAKACEAEREEYVEGWADILGRGTVDLGEHIHRCAGVYESCAKAIRAIDSLPSAVGVWMDISTAPKDGRVIQVPGGIAHWYEGGMMGRGWYSLTGFERPGRLIQWEVKVWQPLPPLPTPPVNEEGL